MKTQLQVSYQDIISLENLLAAWKEFLSGKRKKRDVQEFGRNLFDNIYTLHQELASLTYVHGGYQSFTVHDPKRRDIMLMILFYSPLIISGFCTTHYHAWRNFWKEFCAWQFIKTKFI